VKVFLIAAVAVAVSGAAFAKDLKGAVMTDSEMDKVTAGSVPDLVGEGTPQVAGLTTQFVPAKGTGVCQTSASGRGSCF